MNIIDCEHAPSPHSDFTTGCGKDSQGKTHCYACCAEMDKAQMIKDGRTTLYLAQKGDHFKITNWPASLAFDPYRVRIGRHNIARVRYDAWFTGPDGKQWHGVTYGDNTQICHCKRSAI